MRHFIRKIFGIFPGEGQKVLRFIKLATVWAIGTCTVDTISISLFTEKIGAMFLPNTYLMIAISMIFISCLYMYLLRFVSPYKLIITTLSLAAISYAGNTLALFITPPKWFWYFLRISSYIFDSSLIACFWIFLDQYHDLQDAKRLFGVYNAAYFLGYIISGTLINLTYAKIGPALLLMVSFFTMIHSIFESRKIMKTLPIIEDGASENYFSSEKKTFSMIVREFFKSPYVLCVVIMSLIVRLLHTCTEFSYLNTIEKVFISTTKTITENTIPEFLGKCKAIISFANIIIGVFFYRNLVIRLGVTNLLLIPPLYFMTLYTEWCIYESLFIAILGIIAVECILFTLEDNNFNLIINAAPAKIRGILRLINDSFFEPIGMLISAIFLLLFTKQNNLLGLSLSFIFICLSLIIRYFYPKSIFNALKENAIQFNKKTIDWMQKLTIKEKKEAKNSLLEALDSNIEAIKLLALKTLLEFNDKKLLEKILQTISYLSTKSKLQAIDLLEDCIFANDAMVIEFINDSKKYSEEEEIVKKSHFYLAKQGFIHPEKAKLDLDSKDLLLRASAIISLKHFKSNNSQINPALNRTIAQKELQLLFNYNEIDEICMGLEILSLDNSDEAIEMAIKYLSHNELKIKQKAAETLSKITDKSDSKYASKIINAIKETTENTFRLNCIKALGNINDSTTIKDIIQLSIHLRPLAKREIEDIIIKMGLKTVPILTSLIKDISLNERARILSAKILAKLSLAQLKNNLVDIVTKEIKKAYFYFYWTNTIQKKHPLHDLSLLQNALHTGFQSIIDFIVHISAEASLIEDCELIVKALHTKTTKAHAHAIETLEKSIDKNLFSKIKPLINDIPIEYQLQHCEKYIDTTLNLKELLDKLENSHLFFDKIIAAHLKAKLQIPNWQQSLKEQIKKSDESFHQFTYELLEL